MTYSSRLFTHTTINNNYSIGSAKLNLNEIFQRLSNNIDWEQKYFYFSGKRVNMPRLVAYHGDPEAVYTYSGIINFPSEWTQDLLIIKKIVSDISGYKFNSVLLNKYRDGNDSISWHSDDEPEMEGYIASVSLGATRSFIIRNKNNHREKHTFELDNGSLLIMHEDVQKIYEHSIPKQKHVSLPRINLTFRRVKSKK